MDVLARTKELLGSLADVTESGSRIARYRIEVANLDRKLGLALRRVGERAWQLQSEGRTDILADAAVRSAFDEVRRLRARMEVIRAPRRSCPTSPATSRRSCRRSASWRSPAPTGCRWRRAWTSASAASGTSAPRPRPYGSIAQWYNSGNGFALGCTTWGSCDISVIDPGMFDMSFEVFGTEIPVELQSFGIE